MDEVAEPRPSLPRPRRSGPVALALTAVAALHLGFLSLLGRPSAKQEAPRRPVAVTFRLLPQVDRQREPRADRAPDPPPARPAARDPSLGNVRQPAAITPANAPSARAATPASSREFGAPGAMAAAAPVEASPLAEPPASQPRVLDLNLPRGYSQRLEGRNPVVDDPRANTAKRTPEQRMAGAFDTREIQEQLGDGRWRVRRGAHCAILTPARTSQIFPMEPSAARVPGTWSECP